MPLGIQMRMERGMHLLCGGALLAVQRECETIFLCASPETVDLLQRGSQGMLISAYCGYEVWLCRLCMSGGGDAAHLGGFEVTWALAFIIPACHLVGAALSGRLAWPVSKRERRVAGAPMQPVRRVSESARDAAAVIANPRSARRC